jgi:hypothetical protein
VQSLVELQVGVCPVEAEQTGLPAWRWKPPESNQKSIVGEFR